MYATDRLCASPLVVWRIALSGVRAKRTRPRSFTAGVSTDAVARKRAATLPMAALGRPVAMAAAPNAANLDVLWRRAASGAIDMWMGALIPGVSADDQPVRTSEAPVNDRLDGAGSRALAGWLVLATFAVGALAALRRPMRLSAGQTTHHAGNAAAS